MKNYEIGGQEVVTATLAKIFTEHNHKVCITSFKQPNETMKNRTDNQVKFYTLNGFSYNKKNVNDLHNILLHENIEVVINQWGLPYLPMKVLNKAKKGLNIKIISVYHNDPLRNARIENIEIALAKTNNKIKRFYLIIWKRIIKFITSKSMVYVYNNSDIYQVLSSSFIENFKKFTGIKKPIKLIVQENPITVKADNFIFNPINKQKEIIYVGRIDYNQKRVDRIINTWSLLEKKFPEWKLTIVGDGIERRNFERLSNSLGLKHISFEGFQRPEAYYKRSRILILTSEYEGFGLVLIEGMAFGVIPFAYGSYSAVFDIINQNVNGVIIPYHKEGYSPKEAAFLLEKIMKDETKYNEMALNAIDTSKKYSTENIYKSWEQIFQEL